MLRAGEEKLGCDIVGKALRAPVRLIASNAGVEGDVIIEKLLGLSFEMGYNAVSSPLGLHPGLFCDCRSWMSSGTGLQMQVPRTTAVVQCTLCSISHMAGRHLISAGTMLIRR